MATLYKGDLELVSVPQDFAEWLQENEPGWAPAEATVGPCEWMRRASPG